MTQNNVSILVGNSKRKLLRKMKEETKKQGKKYELTGLKCQHCFAILGFTTQNTGTWASNSYTLPIRINVICPTCGKVTSPLEFEPTLPSLKKLDA